MELKDYFRLLRRWWWLLLLGTLLGGATGYAAFQARTPLYRTRATVMIGSFIQSANPDNATLNTSRYLARNYADFVNREPVLEAVAQNLEGDFSWTALQNKVSASPVPDTPLLEITVTDTDPGRAKAIVDEVTRQLILQSPTSRVDEAQSAYRDFVKGQLAGLQTNITGAQQRLQLLQANLELESTEEGLRRRDQEIAALQGKLDTWQANYASLLAFIGAGDGPVNLLTIMESATLPVAPINASPIRDVALGFAIGLLLATGLVFLFDSLDNTINTEEDVERLLALPTLGRVPKISRRRRRKSWTRGQVMVVDGAYSPAAEAYRTLRTNIQFSSLVLTSSVTSLLVTSAGAGEGKSTTAANLATVMAQSGKQIILVDGDLRRPALHTMFELTDQVGLTTLLLDSSWSLTATLQPTVVKGLRLLSTGPLPPNAADLLTSDLMGQLLTRLSEQADMVIFDSPPLLAVTDSSILATRVGGTLLVVEAGRTRTGLVGRGIATLKRVGVTPMGIILNKSRRKGDASNGYGCQKYYGSSGNGKHPGRKSVTETSRLAWRVDRSAPGAATQGRSRFS
jgi:non-specific protein-tyrosine kinase